MEHARYLGYHEKTKPTNMGVEEGEEIQIKSLDNLFNRIIAENFHNLKKKISRCRKLTEHQTIKMRKTLPDIS
jgi:CTP synthase (UTP-ammonia lyase)